MRSHRMSTVALKLVFGIALIANSALLTSCGAPKEPQAAFETRCGKCHEPRDIQNWGRQRPDAATRQAWLDQFLRLHYPPPEAERALIISYIQSTIAGQPSPQ